MTKDQRIAQLEYIINETIWMARRYADGRRTFAPSTVNECIDLALKLGLDVGSHSEPMYAEDGDLGSWDPKNQTFQRVKLERLVIAGSRHLSLCLNEINKAIQGCNINMLNIKTIVSGGCQGVDVAGEYFAEENNLEIKRFRADWDAHGKAAGPIRNRQMAQYGDALLLIWDGKSRGSRNMKMEMERLDKPVFEWFIV